MVRLERVCESRFRGLWKRAAHESGRTLSVPQERGSGARESHEVRRRAEWRDPLRDPQPHEYGEVWQPSHEQRDQLDGLWPGRYPGGFHADLAAELQVQV